jgi:hypothetical protein
MLIKGVKPVMQANEYPPEVSNDQDKLETNPSLGIQDLLFSLSSTSASMSDEVVPGKLVIEHLFQFDTSYVPNGLYMSLADLHAITTIMVQDITTYISLFTQQVMSKDGFTDKDSKDSLIGCSARLGSAIVIMELLARSHFNELLDNEHPNYPDCEHGVGVDIEEDITFYND